MISASIFYLFATMLIVSAVSVVTVRNTIHAVMALIFAFFNAAGLFVLVGAEFLAMMMLIVYVGAVAVMFLFVVMMLDMSRLKRSGDWTKYLPIGGTVAAIMVFELGYVFWNWQTKSEAIDFIANPTPRSIPNVKAIGELLYVDYIYLFQLSGLILLVAMIGAITLTLRKRAGVRRQDVNAQRERDPKKVLELHQPKSGEGVNV